MLANRRKKKFSRTSKEENKDAQITALKQKLVDAKDQLKLSKGKIKTKAAEVELLKKELANKEAQLKQSAIEKKWAITEMEQQLLGAEMKLKENDMEKKWAITALDNDLLDTEKKLRETIQQNEEKDKYIMKLKNQIWDMEDQLNKVDRTDHISSLPGEILVKIFGYLSHNDLGRVAQVSKRCKENARSIDLWKVVTFFCDGSLNDVAANFCENLSINTTHLKVSSHHIECQIPLDFGSFCERLHKKCPHLRVLIFRNIKIRESLWSVLDACAKLLKKLKVLVFHLSGFGNWFRIQNSNLVSKLEVLDVSYCHDIGNIYNDRPCTRMPRLKKLHFAYSSGNMSSWIIWDTSLLAQLEVLNLKGKSICPYTFQKIVEGATNLTELYLCYNYSVDDERLYGAKFHKLKTICLRSCINVTCEAIISLVQSHDSLINVYSDNEMAESYATHPFVVCNESKLKVLKAIQECDHFSEVNYLHEYKDII